MPALNGKLLAFDNRHGVDFDEPFRTGETVYDHECAGGRLTTLLKVPPAAWTAAFRFQDAEEGYAVRI
jgi:hypothetical protein